MTRAVQIWLIVFALSVLGVASVALADDRQDKYVSYSVRDSAAAGAPALTHRQKDWLRKVHCTPYYAKLWPHLRYSLASYKFLATPLIVFDGRFVVGGGDHIVGAPCDLYFDPFSRGAFAAPSDVTCNPSAPPPPPIAPKVPCFSK